MSDSDNLILKILSELREKHEQTNARLDEMSSTLHAVQDQLVADRGDITAIRSDVTDLRAELAAVEIRGATRDTELIASSRNLGKMLEDRFELRERVERLESDVDILKQKVG